MPLRTVVAKITLLATETINGIVECLRAICPSDRQCSRNREKTRDNSSIAFDFDCPHIYADFTR